MIVIAEINIKFLPNLDFLVHLENKIIFYVK